MAGGRGKWKERPTEVKILDRKRGSRLLPYSPVWWSVAWGNTPAFSYSQGDLLKRLTCTPLTRLTYVTNAHTTVNKTHTWEVWIFTFQTPDRGCTHKNPGSYEQRFKKKDFNYIVLRNMKKAEKCSWHHFYISKSLHSINEWATYTVGPS